MTETPARTSLMEKPLFHFILIIAICLIAYSNTLNAPFEFDDGVAIIENPIVRNFGFMVNPSEAKAHKGPFGYELFRRRYVGYLTFALNYRIHKLDVAGYHVVNLYVHIINALIVYWLVILTFKTPFLSSSTLRAYSNQVALFAGLFFACHPVQTQAVVYIWQRVALLATTFYVLSLVMYIKWRLTSNKTGSFFSRMPLLFYFGSVISAVLAMKTKEIAFTLPVVIFLYELMFFGGNLKKRFLYLAPLLLTMLIIPISLIGLDTPIGELISDVSAATRVGSNISRWDYLLTQFTVIVTYIRLIFLPINQNLDYDYPIYNTFLAPEVFSSFLLLFCIFGLGVYLFLNSKHRNSTFRLIAFGIFWFFITLSVESSFVPLMNVIFEHRVYLPSVGFSIALASGVFLLLNKFGQRKLRAIGVAIFTAVIIVLSVVTYARNTVWRSQLALWQDCVEKSPQKARPHLNMGVALAKQGRTEEAVEHYLQALKIKPDYVMARNNLGTVFANEGKLDEAIFHYEKALRAKPDNPMTLYNIGRAFYGQENFSQAAYYFKEALRYDPEHVGAHNNLAIILFTLGELDEAFLHYSKALQTHPEDADIHYNLGNLLMKKGKYSEAKAHFTQALVTVHFAQGGEINPEYAKIYNKIGLILVQKGKLEQAGRFFLKAIQINPEFTEARQNLENLKQTESVE